MKSPFSALNTVELLRNSSIFHSQSEQSSTEKKFKSKNLKKILLLVKNREKLSPRKEQLLKKIISSIEINWQDVDLEDAILIKENALSEVSELSDYQNVVMFGIRIEDLGVHEEIRLNQSFEKGNTKMLVTFSLEELMDEKSKKIALWKGLREQFFSLA